MKTVLIVEDDLAQAGIWSDALSERGLRALVAEDAAAALGLFRQRTVDLVVVDGALPEGGPLDLVGALRCDLAGRTLPVILVGAPPGDELEKRSLGIFEELGPAPERQHFVDTVERASQSRIRVPVPRLPRRRARVPERGTLEETPVGRIFGSAFASRCSGSLMVQKETIKKIVYFEQGLPIFVKSSLLDECLGRVMVREKLITERENAQSIERMVAEGRRQGDVLMEMGSISPHNLEFALERQMEIKLFDLLSWSEGRFLFHASETYTGTRIYLPKDPVQLLFESARRSMSVPQLYRELDRFFSARLAPIAEPAVRHRALALEPRALRLLRSIDGRRTVRELLRDSEIDRDAAAQLLYALLSTHLLQTEARARTEDLPELEPREVLERHSSSTYAVLDTRAVLAASREVQARDVLSREEVISELFPVDLDAINEAAEALSSTDFDDVWNEVDPDEVTEIRDEDEPALVSGVQAQDSAEPAFESAAPDGAGDRYADGLVAESDPLVVASPDVLPDDGLEEFETSADQGPPIADDESTAPLDRAAELTAGLLDFEPPRPPRDAPRVRISDLPRAPSAREESELVRFLASEGSALIAPERSAPRLEAIVEPRGAEPRSRITLEGTPRSAVAAERSWPAALSRAAQRSWTSEPARSASDARPGEARARVQAELAKAVASERSGISSFEKRPSSLPAPAPPPPVFEEATRLSRDEQLRTLAAERERVRGANAYDILQLGERVDPEAVETAFGRLQQLFAAGRFDAAAQDFGVACALEEVVAVHRRARATLFDPLRRVAYDRRLSRDDEPVLARVMAAEQAYQEGLALLTEAPAEAAEAFERAATGCPDEGVYLAYWAWAAFWADQTNVDALVASDPALARLAEAASRRPRLEEAYLFSGLILLELGEREAAVRELERALACNRDSVRALAALRTLRPVDDKKGGLLRRLGGRGRD